MTKVDLSRTVSVCDECKAYVMATSYCSNPVSNHFGHRITGNHPACPELR